LTMRLTRYATNSSAG